jgi:hypothetical protein
VVCRDRREAVVNFYDRWVLPPILDLVMRQHQLQKYRREVVAAANGRVLEVGVGSLVQAPATFGSPLRNRPFERIRETGVLLGGWRVAVKRRRRCGN